MKAIAVNGTIHESSGLALLPSVTAGLAVDLGYPSFDRTADIVGAVEIAAAEQAAILATSIAALEAANASLQAENGALVKKNKALNRTVEQMKNAEMPADEPYIEMQPITVFFSIGKTALDEFELRHLDFYAKNIIDKINSDPAVEIVIMGSADSNTGTAKRNQYLSDARGQYMINLLSEKYGIDKNKVTVKSEVVKAKAQPEMDRAVVISFR
jgi:outer membrane protein OmpA-like peptidoglycan-associated protein